MNLHSHCETATSHKLPAVLSICPTQFPTHSTLMSTNPPAWQGDEHAVASSKLCACRLSKMIDFGQQVLKLLEGEGEEENKD